MEIVEEQSLKLDAEELIKGAQAATGLNDFGEPALLPGLQVLVDAINNEANLRPSGVEAQRGGLTNLLVNRLRVADLFNHHPEIAKEKIEAPIIIIGLPRSGTTKLQQLISADTRLQSLPLWKVLNPAPFPDAPAGAPDPRIAFAEQVSTAMRDYFPDFYAGHPMNALEPEEEAWMMDMSMRGWTTCYVMRIPSFANWLYKQDFASWYKYLYKLLQQFQWQDGSPKKRWLLKAPEHFPYMELLFKTFPDATVVHCHRDPVAATSSLGALTAASRRLYSDDTPLSEGGGFSLEHWSQHMLEYLRQREPLEKKHHFVDVSYAELTGDIFAAVERIYQAAGMPLTDEARAAMKAWDAAHPPGRFGKHSYTTESQGLSDEEIRTAFAGYIERFGEYLK